MQNSKAISSYSFEEGITVEVKDLGPQLPYKYVNFFMTPSYSFWNIWDL